MTAQASEASESPEALKNDCPCAAICLNIPSEVGSGEPGEVAPQEQLICRARLSLAILLKIVAHEVPPWLSVIVYSKESDPK